MAPLLDFLRGHFISVVVSTLVVFSAMLLISPSLSPLVLVPNLMNAWNPIVRDVRTGVSYRGTFSNGVEQFQNIFYAEDTSGSNRFAPPVPYMPARVFGFATSKALVTAKQANNGLRDQRAAFDWVHDNIKAFGGDPSNVIAIGQSVGASSIALHLVSSGTRGVPFQKAM
ncbi:MAG: hypothetical protein Q9181_007741 [Wetmoreana brouardii]